MPVRLLPVVAVVAIVAFAAAGGRSSEGQQAPSAQLSFFQLSPDAPAIDVYIDGGRVVDGLAFGEVSQYVSVIPGSHLVTITPARRLDALLTVNTTLQPGASFTWVLPGVIFPQDIGAAFTPDLQFAHAVTLNDNAGPAPDARPRVRVLNASPGSGPLDVRLDGPAATTLASGLTYGNVSTYASLDPGTYAVSVYPTGGTTPIEPPYQVMVQGQTAYTLVMGGLLPQAIPANSSNPSQPFRIQQLTDENMVRTAPLTAGCNQVVLNLPVGTPILNLIPRVENPSLVTSIWRFDNATKQLRAGYFSDPTAPVDFTTTSTSPEAAFICVSGDTTWVPAI